MALSVLVVTVMSWLWGLWSRESFSLWFLAVSFASGFLKEKSGIAELKISTRPFEKAAKMLGDFFSVRVKVESFSVAADMVVLLVEVMLMLLLAFRLLEVIRVSLPEFMVMLLESIVEAITVSLVDEFMEVNCFLLTWLMAFALSSSFCCLVSMCWIRFIAFTVDAALSMAFFTRSVAREVKVTLLLWSSDLV